MMRGEGRSAELAASFNLGFMCSRTVRGPTQARVVPSAIRPATLSAWGPSAATTTGQGCCGLKKVSAWIPVEARFDGDPGPTHAPELAAERYDMSRCMMCGCCLDACPQVGPRSEFVGAAILNQVALMNTHPSGKADSDARLEALMTEHGAADCGNAQNCVKVCPKGIPLVDSIAKVNRQLSVKMFKDLFTAKSSS